MSLIRKHGAVLQAWACLDLVWDTATYSMVENHKYATLPLYSTLNLRMFALHYRWSYDCCKVRKYWAFNTVRAKSFDAGQLRSTVHKTYRFWKWLNIWRRYVQKFGGTTLMADRVNALHTRAKRFVSWVTVLFVGAIRVWMRDVLFDRRNLQSTINVLISYKNL